MTSPAFHERDPREPTYLEPGPHGAPSYQAPNYFQPPASGMVVPSDNFRQPAAPMLRNPGTGHPSAVSTLVLGIMGIVVFPPLAFAALTVGNRARRDIRDNPAVYQESGTLTTGWVLGIVGSALCAFYVLLVLAIIMFGVASY